MCKSCRSSRQFIQHREGRSNLQTLFMLSKEYCWLYCITRIFSSAFHFARAKFDIDLTGFQLTKTNVLASQYHWETNVISDLTSRWIVPSPKNATGTENKFVIYYLSEHHIQLISPLPLPNFHPRINMTFFPKITNKQLFRKRILCKNIKHITKHVIRWAVFCVLSYFWDFSDSETCHYL